MKSAGVEILGILFCIFYFLYTLHYAIIFNRSDVFFSDKQKLAHNICIWLVPFIWIAMLKLLREPIEGSHQYRKKKPGADDYSLESRSDGE